MTRPLEVSRLPVIMLPIVLAVVEFMAELRPPFAVTEMPVTPAMPVSSMTVPA